MNSSPVNSHDIPETFLITGASSGIGLAVTSRLLSQGKRVFATCRQPQTATELISLKEQYPELLDSIALDVNSDESIESAVKEVFQKTSFLDVLINMAGILPQPAVTRLEDLDFEQCRVAFETNSLAPLRISRAFLPLLRKSKYPRVINISSDAGSYAALRNCGLKAFIKNPSLDKGKGLLKKLLKKLFPFLSEYRKSTNLDQGQKYAYSTSKVALNMLTCCFAYEFKSEGIICVALDPGWVKTRMGGADAPLTVDESAAAIVKTINRLTMKQTSRFIYNNGKEREW